MEEKEREIEVRTLTGESAMVTMSGNKTVDDLKLLLKNTFPFASSSPNFHLFFKGVKLSLQSQIQTLAIESGEFLVLIPFVKKSRPQNPKPEFSTKVPEETPISRFADSAYSDMMQDLSSLFDKSNDSPGQLNCGLNNTANANFALKQKRYFDSYNDNCYDEGGPYAFLWSVLQSPNKNIMEDQNCEKFVEVLESLNCLTDPHSGRCVLVARGANGDIGVCRENKSLCFCPVWLKRIMGAFAFLNLFSAFLHMQRKETTCAHLKEVLKQLGKYGFRAGFEDIEHLSILCPKVVLFANSDTKLANSADALVIINSETEERDEIQNNPRNVQKAISLSKAFGAIKKRESSFKTSVWEAARFLMEFHLNINGHLMLWRFEEIRLDGSIKYPVWHQDYYSSWQHKNGNANVMLFSLEDLIKFVNDGSSVGENEAKRAKRSQSSTSSRNPFRKQCHDTNQLLPVEMVRHLREGIGSKGQIVHVEDIEARKAIHVEIPHKLSDNTKAALKRMGITKLYSHQAESILASLAGKNVVVATMTSSGKSLCYNVPVLEVLSQNLSSCALYLFPTKALAQDQLRALLAMTRGSDTSINIGVYDGDTSHDERLWLRSNARLLITNPDMLHVSILPSHRQFSRILSNLRYVVIDEAHAYKGAFGCHTALILRRLRRLCSHVYGSDPSFVFSTATSANPQEHCMELANLSTLELIKNDGSPSSQKLFVLWNPTSCIRTVSDNSEGGMHVSESAEKSLSPIWEVSLLFAEMLQHGLRCIAFCRSRKLTELVLFYTREILQETAPHLVESICAYRAGYVAEDRRKIERDFFSGKLCGMAATNALELGIDVGHIDATLHLGFPGSIASLWQQAGRSGRREKPSLAVYVAFDGPLDQYFMKFPNKLFGGPIECCHIDAQNQQVLEQHLLCAAFEHPLSLLYDEKYFGSGLDNAMTCLKNRGDLGSDPSHDSSARIWIYIGCEKMPSRGISIRAIETVRYKVIDMACDEILEEIEESRAFFQVYEGAVYMNQGKTYLVKELDISEKIALCHKADLKYYTKIRDYTDIHVPGGDSAYPARVFKNQSPRTTAQANFCKVTTTWFGFYCIQRGSNKVLDVFDLSLPKYSYESQAVWIPVPQLVKNSVEEKKFSFRGGLHAASHAVLKAVPLYVRCNSSDLAPECPNPHETRYFPERILVYDQRPGGTGVSKQLQPYFTELLNAALELLTSCQCFGDTGCPDCVQSMVCHEYNEEIDKYAAIVIIKGVLDAEKSFFEGVHDSSLYTKE